MLYTYLSLQAVLLGLSAWTYIALVRFLRTCPSIVDKASLDLFRCLARQNMYGAIAYLVFGVPTLLLGVYLFLTRGLVGFVAVLVTSLPSYLLSRKVRALEVVARNARCADELLLAEHREIGQAWLKNALPNF